MISLSRGMHQLIFGFILSCTYILIRVLNKKVILDRKFLIFHVLNETFFFLFLVFVFINNYFQTKIPFVLNIFFTINFTGKIIEKIFIMFKTRKMLEKEKKLRKAFVASELKHSKMRKSLIQKAKNKEEQLRKI